jgi:phosphotriesterase-related protein
MAAGKALSVLGPISPEELGIVLPHEHLLLDFKQAFISRDPDSSKLSFCMENLGTIRQYPYSTIDNLCVDSEDDLIHELQLYKQAGGSTLCDLTVTGIRINPEALPRISAASGVHIILGSGYYVDQFIPDDIKGIDVETIASTIVSEIENGLGTSGVRCGIIGEIGCSWPLTVYERKVLQGAAIAQSKTGAPLIIHPGRDERAPFEIVDILKQAGADISRTVMSHIDRTIMSRDNLLKFAQSGCGIEYDLFGIECSHYQVCLV